MGAALSLQAAGVCLPPLQALLGTEALPLTDLLIVCGVSGLGHVVMRSQARLWPERPPDGRPAHGRPAAGSGDGATRRDRGTPPVET
ncbi:hypothetical protein ACFY12_10775 [Streptomyces sp. NPDC001339]|uniref:hypothetical protein n=1 Tax=Streptomyces sp. NPDC001339 TaxID=3364563 RepID=UPI0036BB524F